MICRVLFTVYRKFEKCRNNNKASRKSASKYQLPHDIVILKNIAYNNQLHNYRKSIGKEEKNETG